MVTTHDAATLNGFGPDLGSPRILAILQHTSFSDLRENNHKASGCCCCWWMLPRPPSHLDYTRPFVCCGNVTYSAIVIDAASDSIMQPVMMRMVMTMTTMMMMMMMMMMTITKR